MPLGPGDINRIRPRSQIEKEERQLAMNNKPKVMATGIAGVFGAMAVWGWNTWMVGTDWVLEDPVNGLAVTLIAFMAGPALRAYERWTG